MTIVSERVPLKDFLPDEAIDLWWNDKVHRPNQNPRKVNKKQKSGKRSQEKDGAGAIASSSKDYIKLSSDSEVEVQSASHSGSESDKESLSLLDQWDWMKSYDLTYVRTFFTSTPIS